MRYRGDVFYKSDIEACGLKSPKSGFAAGTGAFDKDFDILDSVLLSLLGGYLGCHLRSEWSAFPGPLEPLTSRARP